MEATVSVRGSVYLVGFQDPPECVLRRSCLRATLCMDIEKQEL